MALPETKRALIVVRTYPTPATKGVEVSCTAAITNRGEWLRLFPIPYRFLTHDQRFRKYQWIDVTVTKASDARPESFKLHGETPIRIVSDVLPTDNEWQARKDIVFQVRAASLCSLVRERDANGFPTLGLFRPKMIERLTMEDDSPEWSPEQAAMLRQGDLFEQGPDEELERVPYKFRYQFRCDDAACSGHHLLCIDWEMGEAWRSWKEKYGTEWEAKFRHRFEAEMIEKYDTHFYVGTVHQHPGTWIIVGLFYPPRPGLPLQGALFE